LHFILRNSPFTFNELKDNNGDLLEIIDPGEYNNNSGPDFFNSKVRLGETIWAGNVEMHINSADWYSHGHQSDSAYDSVILHVVVKDDRPAVTSKGRLIPTIVVEYPNLLEWKLLNLTGSGKWISCEENFGLVDYFAKSMWLSSLMVERLEQKNQHVLNLVNEADGSWEEAFYYSQI
jgi:hypothetical protein